MTRAFTLVMFSEVSSTFVPVDPGLPVASQRPADSPGRTAGICDVTSIDSSMEMLQLDR